MDLICIFAQILHGIRDKSIVACLVFGEKGEIGFFIIDLTFFEFFSSFFGGAMATIQKNNYRGDFQTMISPSYRLIFLRIFFFGGRIL